MPYVASVGTYLPCWGSPLQRVAGENEDAVTMAVEHFALGIKDLLPSDPGRHAGAA